MLYERYPMLTDCRQAIENALLALIRCYESDGKLLICGNGGSSADSDHIVGELMKGFLSERRVGETFTVKLKQTGIEDAEAIT